MTSINDILWGGGELIADSPEAPAMVPPSREEIAEFIEKAQRSLRDDTSFVQMELPIQ